MHEYVSEKNAGRKPPCEGVPPQLPHEPPHPRLRPRYRNVVPISIFILGIQKIENERARKKEKKGETKTKRKKF